MIEQIIGYGTLYCSTSVLAPSMAREFGWYKESIFGAFSVALLIGWLTAPWAGRWIDRYGVGRIMTMGSIGAAAALMGPVLAPGQAALVLGLIAGQVASTLVQYSAAFALLVQLRPAGAQRSITHLTLIAGFASTIFWPITAALQAHLTWQQIYLVFAVLHLLFRLPLHFCLSHLGRKTGRSHPFEAGFAAHAGKPRDSATAAGICLDGHRLRP